MNAAETKVSVKSTKVVKHHIYIFSRFLSAVVCAITVYADDSNVFMTVESESCPCSRDWTEDWENVW